jgi:hypothetical protein
MATVDDGDDMTARRRDVVDEQRELLVEEVRPSLAAAVGADQGVEIAAVGLEVPQRVGHRGGRAVSAEPEQRRVAGSGLGQMRAEPVDDRRPGRLLVEQRHECEPGARVRTACPQEPGRVGDVGPAAGQVRDIRAEIPVDADHEGVERGHRRISVQGAGASVGRC